MDAPTSVPFRSRARATLTAVLVVALLFVFLLGVKALGEGFELLGEDLIESFFAATDNPIVGLFVGLLATTLLQSSSVTTSMIVGLVAAPESPLPLANAIPMVMGANIGTTITNTLVSLAHLGRREEFERAFPIAICHDVFNYLAVLVLLPLELSVGFLQNTSIWLATALGDVGGVQYQSPLRSVLSAGYAPVDAVAAAMFSADGARAVFVIGVAGLSIFFALFMLVKVMRSAMHHRVESLVGNPSGSSAVLAILIGIVVTIMVQSSSITTSLLVPLGAAGLLRLEQAFPITLGANIGTTVTSLLAALAVSGPNAAAGLEIALVHVLFNVSGLLLIFPVKAIRNIPLAIARSVTSLAIRSRRLTVLAVGILFYGVPALLIVLSRLVP